MQVRLRTENERIFGLNRVILSATNTNELGYNDIGFYDTPSITSDIANTN
jgi:hypothetical protein